MTKGKHGAAATIRRDWQALESRAAKAERELAKVSDEACRLAALLEQERGSTATQIRALRADVESSTSDETRKLGDFIGKLLRERSLLYYKLKCREGDLTRMGRRALTALVAHGASHDTARTTIFGSNDATMSETLAETNAAQAESDKTLSEMLPPNLTAGVVAYLAVPSDAPKRTAQEEWNLIHRVTPLAQ